MTKEKYQTLYKIIMLCFSLLFVFCTISILDNSFTYNKKSYANNWIDNIQEPINTTIEDNILYTLIENEQNLAYVMANINSPAVQKTNYMITTNLNMSGYEWTPIGIHENTVYEYSGIFNGKGFVISNLTSTHSLYAGLFAKTRNATIINVSLSNCNITSNNYSGGIIAHMIGGKLSNCIITNCQVSSVYNLQTNLYVGGAVGYAESNALIEKIMTCSTFDDINISAIEMLSNRSIVNIGGIAGYTSPDTIVTNCSNSSNVKAVSYFNMVYAGGIIGYSEGSISYSENHSNIEGGNETCNSSYVGGIVGYSTSSVSNCFNIGEKVNAFAKLNTLTEKITQIKREQEQLSYKNSHSGVIGKKKQYWYITTRNLDSPPISHERTIKYDYAYAGGIAGHAQTVSTCYVADHTNVSGGKKEYTDNYMTIYSYLENVSQYNIIYWYDSHKSNARTYFITISYVQTHYYSQIAGTRTTNIDSSYSSKKYTENLDYSYSVNVWENQESDSGFGLGGLLDLLNLIPNGSSTGSKVGYQTGTLNASTKKISLSDNTLNKDLQEYFSRNQSIGFYLNFSTTSFQMHAYTNHNGSEKFNHLTDEITIDQSSPNGFNVCNTLENANLSSLNSLFDSSIWKTNSSINNGYPYISSNHWN